MPGSYSLDLRERVVAACDEGQLSRRKIAELYQVGESTIYEWLNRRRETTSLAPLPRTGGRASGLDATVLSDLVEVENDQTLEEYAAGYAQRTGRAYSISHICRGLQAVRLWRKKTLRASEQLRTDVVEARAAFQAEIQQVAPEDLVFIDESGITTQMVRRFARAQGGSRALGRAPCKYKSLTLLGALSLTGLRALMTIPAATDEAVFLAFIEQVLVPELKPGQVVVFDNLSAHKRPAITAAIEKAGCRVVLLPPYTPEWNPIEACWSKMKEFLRARAARTLETLEAAVVDAMEAVSAQDARGWFRHCGYKVALD